MRGKESGASRDEAIAGLVRRHLIVGWVGLTLFAAFGLVLESFHGLKLDYYLDVRNESRRLMWTLAHTHGTLVSLVNIAAAYTFSRISPGRHASLRWISRCLVATLILLPGGFFLGGIKTYGGDPAPAVLLVPVGAAALIAAAWLMAVSLIRGPLHDSQSSPAPERKRRP